MADPAWVPCPGCDDFWCVIHQQHAHDCPCPAVEEWDVDPYSAGGERVAPPDDWRRALAETCPDEDMTHLAGALE